MDILTEIAQTRFEVFEKQDPEEISFDISFKFADEKILKSHKFMLSSLSEAFKAMFSENWNKTGIIEIKLNTFEEFKELLKFCYLGYSAVSEGNVDSLLELSHCYNIPVLTKVCISFIEIEKIINCENVVQYFEMAEIYEFNELLKIVASFLENVTSRFLKSDTFLNAKKEFVMYLLGMDKVAIEEGDLFKAALEWGTRKYSANADKSLNKNDFLKEELKDILPLIRFPKMNFNFLVKDVVQNAYLFSAEDLSNILQDAFEFHENKSIVRPRSGYSCDSRIEKYIEITDINLKKISAPFLYFNERLISDIDKTSGNSVRLSNGSYWKFVKLEKPKTPAIFDKTFYYFLVIDRDSDLAIKEVVESGDYVIAQFKHVQGFSSGEGCRIKCIRK